METESRVSWLPYVAVALTTLVAPLTAHAHIDVTGAGTHDSRAGDQKTSPCGSPGSTRGTTVYQYKPGMSSLSAVKGRNNLTMQKKFEYDLIYA